MVDKPKLSQGVSVDGIRRTPRPKKPVPDLRPDHDLPAPKPTKLLDEPIGNEGADEGLSKKPSHWKRWVLIILGLVITLFVIAGAVAYSWYQQSLQPASDDTTKYIRVTIEPGSIPSAIAEQLETAGVIRSSLAFTIYAKLTATENKLQAGVYTLQPTLSTPKIVDYLVSGKQHTFKVTFLPGDTLANNRQRLIDLKLFDTTDIDAALSKTYDRPLFDTKPADADLEGYIFGETYHFDASATPESILNQTFDEFEAVITDENLVEGFKKQKLTLFEGITLASIVQREVPNAEDQRQVARVFYNRIANDMNLGSDVTYQYAADKLDVQRTPTLDSPYNTRIHTGLPPGPIAAPGANALIAVANPAKNDYLFFLSGDDDQTYFAVDEAGHQQNIDRHCKKKCLIL